MRMRPESFQGSAAFRRLNPEFAGPQDEPRPATGTDDEGALHDAILAECRSRGWPVVHSRMDRPATVQVGTPDFAIALPGGRVVWLEAKTRTGKLTMPQRAWLVALERVGHACAVVRSVDEARAAIRKALEA